MFGLLAVLLAVSPPHFQAAPGWHVGSRPPLGRWPPRIRRTDLHIGAEGVPRRYSYAQWFVRAGGVEHHLWVWFGRAHPTRQQLARANVELRTVH
jgi:hypothetical protein